jgi:poly(3-hydroxybutyrate) depolymerase
MRLPLPILSLLIPFASLPALDEARTLDHDGLVRHYLIHVPATLPPGPRPLVLALHPSNSNAAQFRSGSAPASAGEWDRKADAGGFLLVYPNGTAQASWSGFGPAPATDLTSPPTITDSSGAPVAARFWNSYAFTATDGTVGPGSGVDDAGFLAALIGRISADHAVDADRVYITGFSNGAMMTNTFAILRPDLVAAAGPVSGGWINDDNPAYEAALWPAAPIPVWTWRGSKEAVLKPTGGLTRQAQDEAQRAWWIDRSRTDATPAAWTSSADGFSLHHETYAGGLLGIEYRFTTVGDSLTVGTSHRWQPGAVDLLWDFFAANPRRAIAPVFAWARAVAGTGDQAARGIEVDAAGAVLVCGSHAGDTDLLGSPITTGAADDDAFILRLGPDGGVLWRSTFGATAGKDRLYDVVADRLGRPVATGQFAGSLTLGGTALVSAGGLDAVTACWDPADGTVLWARRAGGTGAIELGNEIARRSGTHGTAVIGTHGAAVSFAGRTLPFQGTGGGGLLADICVLCYGEDGTEAWGAAIGSTAQDGGRAIAGMPDGGVVVAGDVTGGAVITDGAGAQTTLAPAGGSAGKDIVIARFAADGTLRWAIRFAGAGDDYARGIGVDGNGWIVLSGAHTGAITHGGATVASAPAGQGVFIVRLGPDPIGGALPLAWSRTIDGGGSEDGCELQVDRDGSVVAMGDFLSPSLTIGGTVLANRGGKDAFIAALDRHGAWQWALPAGGAGGETAFALAVDWKRGGTFACGTMQDDARFTGATGEIVLPGAPGQYDGFIAGLAWRTNRPPAITVPAAASPATMLLP